MSFGHISASNMHDGRWMFTRRIDPEEHNGNQCEIIGIRTYEGCDVVAVVDWLNDRAAGYPKRDLPWPEFCPPFWAPIPYSDLEGATWRFRTAWGAWTYDP